MIHQTVILSMASFALPFACFLRVEMATATATIRRLNNRALEPEALAPSLNLEPPSKSAGTATKASRRRGLGATSTTTATATSITTTTTMAEDGGEMSPSDFYLLHHREHGFALAEEAAAATEKKYDDEQREPRQQRRRRRGQQRRRRLEEIVKRKLEGQQQQEQQTAPPADEEDDNAAAEQWEEHEEERVGAVAEEMTEGSAPKPSSSSPTGDGDGDEDAAEDINDAPVAGTSPHHSPDSSAFGDIDGGDVVVNITDSCNVSRPASLGDGRCDYDSEIIDRKGYNTAECGWDGGDCCYQTCRDSSVYRCGDRRTGGGYDCLDPRFGYIIYDEEGEQDPQRRRERRALRALYNATNGDEWTGWDDQGRWLNDTLDHCYWDDYEIRCTGGEGYVQGMELGYLNLNGTLPAEVGQLVHLEWLWLDDNEHLSGTIPASIGRLTELTRLNVHGTSLSGPVPANAMVPIFETPGEYYSPSNTHDYAELSPHDCADMVGWVDSNENGCDWYFNDTSSCPSSGTQHRNMGHTADTACCACGMYARYDREGEVLKELYGATDGEGRHNSSFWVNSSMTHCDWTGVQCNDDGMVTNLTLPSSNVLDYIPTKISELRSLQILDVSNNGITGGIPTEVYTLTKLEELHLRNNTLGGTIATELASLTLLRRLDLSHNELSGTIRVGIADLSLVEDLFLSSNHLTGTISPQLGRMSRLKRLDLENNVLWGSIPVDIGLLSLLRELRISNQGVHFSGPIPIELGDCQYLKVLDLSGNWLKGVLPTELARLARMKSLLLHDNMFEGYIPSEYGLLPSLQNITLGVYNEWRLEEKTKPAPLSLCFNEAFDLHSDPLWCPPERNALKRLYDATNGDGWSNNASWIDPYSDYCSWHGVGCGVHVSCRDVPNWTDSTGFGCDWYGLDPSNCKEYGDLLESNNHTANTACCFCQQETHGCFWNGTECRGNVTSLSLISNGLSGPLPAELFHLGELEDLRLGNNRLYGTLPEIVNKKLKVLQLSGNDLSGAIPSSITRLTNLSLLHLHGNRFTTDVPVGLAAPNVTADCGDPYYYGDRKLSCEDCDICCNSEGKCMESVKEPLDLPQKPGLFLGCLMAFLLIFCAIVFILNNFADLPLPKRGAVDYCGKSSVYSFLLTKSCRGWILTFATVAAQVGIFTMFLSAANIDNEDSDWEYYMRCPPNQLWCENDHTVDHWGWLIFGLIMVAFLGKDVISGIMLVRTAGLRTNFFCFVSGIFISTVKGYAVWTSVQYNLAIATSNTALVANAVIILFVNDIGERIFQLSDWLFPGWVAKRTQESCVRSADICAEGSTAEEQTGNTSKLADIGSVAGEQGDEEDETSVPCGEDLHALFTKQNETNEELRAQIKALKTAFEQQTSKGELKRQLSKNPESTS